MPNFLHNPYLETVSAHHKGLPGKAGTDPVRREWAERLQSIGMRRLVWSCVSSKKRQGTRMMEDSLRKEIGVEGKNLRESRRELPAPGIGLGKRYE